MKSRSVSKRWDVRWIMHMILRYKRSRIDKIAQCCQNVEMYVRF